MLKLKPANSHFRVHYTEYSCVDFVAETGPRSQIGLGLAMSSDYVVHHDHHRGRNQIVLRACAGRVTCITVVVELVEHCAAVVSLFGSVHGICLFRLGPFLLPIEKTVTWLCWLAC